MNSGEDGLAFHDFAGSTVVHSVGGWAALVGAAIFGPRLGKYQNGRISAIPGHNMGFATLGCLILWIGWFGFNPGSELAADANVPYIALTTNLAAAAGGVTSTATSWIRDGKPDLSMIINGILAGLVAITAGCDDVSYVSALAIGGDRWDYCCLLSHFLRCYQNRRSCRCNFGSLSCGIWGTLAVGIFGTANIVTQLIGVLAIGAFTVIFSTIVWGILKVTIGIRVHAEDEMRGLDISEHGMEAYSGFVKEADILSGGSTNVSIGATEANEF